MPLGVGSIGRIVANRTKRGLYAGRRVLYGNRVSEDGGNRCGASHMVQGLAI